MAYKKSKLISQKNEDLKHLSPEMALLISIIDSTSSQDKKQKLKKFSSIKLDWMLFLKLAQRHHLTAFIGQKINECDIDIIPSAIKSAITSQSSSNNDRCGILVNELLFITTLLQNENIDTIAFKGPSLAINLYGDVKMRFSRDIDILLKREDMENALSLMEEAGYEFQKTRRSPKLEKAYLDYNGQYLLFSPENKIAVEPHSALGQSMLAINIDYDELFKQTTNMHINHQSVTIFKPEALLIVLCLHGIKESWQRLKWILDIAQLLDQNPDLNWDYVIKQSEKWGLRRSTLLGIKLSMNIFNSDVPENIHTLISNENHIERLTSKIEKEIEYAKPKKEEGHGILIDYLYSRERNRDKISYIFKTILTPKDLHFGIVELPDILHFLYIPIKLIHDYLMLPVWLFFKKAFNPQSKPDSSG